VIDYMHSIYCVRSLVLNSGTENLCLLMGEELLPLLLYLYSESDHYF